MPARGPLATNFKKNGTNHLWEQTSGLVVAISMFTPDQWLALMAKWDDAYNQVKLDVNIDCSIIVHIFQYNLKGIYYSLE